MEMLDQLARAGGITAGLAGGVAGAGYLAKRGVIGFRFMARAGRAIARLAAIGDEQSWPNGSTDLPSFLQGLHSLLTGHLEDHKQRKAELHDDEIDQARATDEWDDADSAAV